MPKSCKTKENYLRLGITLWFYSSETWLEAVVELRGDGITPQIKNHSPSKNVHPPSIPYAVYR